MKKVSLLLLVLSFSAFAAAQKLHVLSSASIFKDMADQIGGDYIYSDAIVPIGGDPHLYEPTPQDARKIQKSDLILVNGMTFEGWINEVIENSGTRAKTILITEGVEPIRSETYKNSMDPHAWMTASNGLIYIKNIKDALVEADPAHKEHYEDNYEAYAQKLRELDAYIEEQIRSIPEQNRVLITSHDAFSYYGRRYGLELNAIMGISTEADAQMSDVQRVSEAIQKHKVPAIFIESTINPKMIRQIARDNGIKIGGELFADSIGEEDSHAPTYYDMLKHNTDTIVKALRGETSLDNVKTRDNQSGQVGLYIILGLVLVGLLILTLKKMNT